eukprot:Lithocolla_globosa_v1_NODE_3847_length_1565_cov_951.360927.p1 type:complete len:213 gc:universal NODE_3847_length_1565_cov_951.360927:1054-416(-)
MGDEDYSQITWTEDEDQQEDDKKEEEAADDVLEVVAEIEEQGGSGNKEDGLWNTEINSLMSSSKSFKGTPPVDKISELPISSKDKKFSFIYNTARQNQEGQHWIAVYVTHDCIEHFDPLADEASEQFKREIRKLLHKWKPSGIFQLKINRVRLQSTTSSNCGFFAIKFIQDRDKGDSWMKATKFEIVSKSIQGEKEIERFKKELEPYKNARV